MLVLRILRNSAVAVLIGLVVSLSVAGPAGAHPLDQLTQHLFVKLDSTQIELTTAIGGGILANELVLSHLDSNGDQSVSVAEESAWIASWLRTLSVSLDGTIVPISNDDVLLEIPPLGDFHFGVTPMLLTFTVPLPATGPESDHLIAINNDYLINRTTYQLEVQSNNGTELIDESWPDASIRIAFSADPSVIPGGNDTATKAAEEWTGNKIIAEARKTLEHERTPAFLITLLGIFALMGALHAMQPGHGKTLVAAYLVATGGTPRDALMLAGIVTFTHTISVYILGLATLGASQLFLPSKVIPVMGFLSGLLVALMGLSMLRGALNSKLSFRNINAPEGADSNLLAPEETHGHHHHPHHGELTDEAHAKLHLEEALAVRDGVSKRRLVMLGISGGMAPCPDALAILLLAIGMNQAGLGMIAIVAFSIGLAAVLVAFGLAVAMFGPAWKRAKSGAAGSSSKLSIAFNRVATAAPLISASVVLLLGLAMAWRSISFG